VTSQSPLALSRLYPLAVFKYTPAGSSGSPSLWYGAYTVIGIAILVLYDVIYYLFRYLTSHTAAIITAYRTLFSLRVSPRPGTLTRCLLIISRRIYCMTRSGAVGRSLAVNVKSQLGY
jgi:hypothetical protein